ncbi:MAG: hypothetical protein Q8R51_15135 [Azonexus sp.]|nr:hypothetical protein [Azonexus sp.]
MKLFNQLPGFIETPPGKERKILRLLPKILIIGTLLLALPSLAARLFISTGSATEIATQIMTIDIYAISLIILHWTIVFTVAIGAFVVVAMKGPAYVADPYPLDESPYPDRDSPKPGRNHASQ